MEGDLEDLQQCHLPASIGAPGQVKSMQGCTVCACLKAGCTRLEEYLCQPCLQQTACLIGSPLTCNHFSFLLPVGRDAGVHIFAETQLVSSAVHQP